MFWAGELILVETPKLVLRKQFFFKLLDERYRNAPLTGKGGFVDAIEQAEQHSTVSGYPPNELLDNAIGQIQTTNSSPETHCLR